MTSTVFLPFLVMVRRSWAAPWNSIQAGATTALMVRRARQPWPVLTAETAGTPAQGSFLSCLHRVGMLALTVPPPRGRDLRKHISLARLRVYLPYARKLGRMRLRRTDLLIHLTPARPVRSQTGARPRRDDSRRTLPTGRARSHTLKQYDRSMSERKSRVTITVDPQLGAYAEQLVQAGQAASVSAAFNDAMAEKAHRDRRRRSFWKTHSDQADPNRVARMMAVIDQQLAQ